MNLKIVEMFQQNPGLRLLGIVLLMGLLVVFGYLLLTVFVAFFGPDTSSLTTG